MRKGEETIREKNDTENREKNTGIFEIAGIADVILKGIALAMGIASVVLLSLDEVETENAVSMLGIGLFCLALAQFSQKKKDGK